MINEDDQDGWEGQNYLNHQDDQERDDDENDFLLFKVTDDDNDGDMMMMTMTMVTMRMIVYSSKSTVPLSSSSISPIISFSSCLSYFVNVIIIIFNCMII